MFNFSYFAESKLCWASRAVEHDPARAGSIDSMTRHLAERTAHDFHLHHDGTLETTNTQNVDKNSVNGKKGLPYLTPGLHSRTGLREWTAGLDCRAGLKDLITGLD